VQYIYTLLFCVLFISRAAGQDTLLSPPQSNISIFHSFCDSIASTSLPFLQRVPQKTAPTVHIISHPAKPLLQQALVAKLPSTIFSLSSSTASIVTNKENQTLYVFRIMECDIHYGQYKPHSDSIIRLCNMVVDIYERTSNGGSMEAGSYTTEGFVKHFSHHHTDTIARAIVPMIETKQYAFTYAPLPPRQNALLEEIVEPLIIIASAAATILLLFSVRSQ
jgi:hypothetical protein